MIHPRLRPAIVTLMALAAGLVLTLPGDAWGQAAWEYSPYQVRIWLLAPPRAELPAAVQQAVAARLVSRSETVLGAVWSTRVEPAPPELAGGLIDQLEMPPERLKELSPDVLNADKLILVRVTRDLVGWQVAARELDCRTRQWNTVVERFAADRPALPLAAWDAVRDSFTPLARIEAVDATQIKARVRAGGLIIDAASPAAVQDGMVLRPVIRRNDRSGQPATKGGIQAIPWTLLSVEEHADALLTCQMFSGFRAAIPSRGGVRTERLALLVRPQFLLTTLVLKSRTAQPRPLTGYEVFAKEPDGGETPLLGVTDWRGQIELPRGDGKLQIFLIRNGTQLLARLPIVPGQAETLEAPLVDDDGRLQAEGAVAALHTRALDLAARREIIAARFRTRLKERKFEEAQALLDQFRQLESRTDLSRSLDEQQQQVQAFDRLTQQRIDKLLSDARQLLTVKTLSDDMINTLAAELVKARSAPQTASATDAKAAATGKAN